MKDWNRATKILAYWISGWGIVMLVLLYILFLRTR